MGGIESVITSCLTHPDSDAKYCDDVIFSLNNIVANMQRVSSGDVRQSHQKTVIDDLILAQQAVTNKTRITTSLSSNAKRPLPSSNQVLVQNPQEYWDSCIIMNPDTYRNLSFKWLNHDKATWIMNVVTNK